MPSPGGSLATAYDPRRNNFDFLRFALATLVLWAHAWPVMGRRGEWVIAVSHGQVTAGSLAVDGFFVLSGFLVMQSWLARPIVGVYVAKRLLRIGPALGVVLALTSLVLAPIVRGDAWAYLRSPLPWAHFASVLAPSLMVIPGSFPGNPQPHVLNASLWSLRYEILCYALVVPVGLLGMRRWRVVVPALLGGSTLCAIALAGRGSDVAVAAHQIACFSAGMLFFLARDSVPCDGRLALAAAAVFVLTLVTRGIRVVFPLVGGYLLLVAAVSPRWPLQRFGRHGDVSYGMYLYGFPVEQTVRWFAGPTLSFGAFLALSFVLTLAAAALSWHFVEAPALARKPR